MLEVVPGDLPWLAILEALEPPDWKTSGPTPREPRLDRLRPYWKAVPYEPVCAEQAVPVCLHPAYQALLPEIAAIVEKLARPLEGIPGAPTGMEQSVPFGLHKTSSFGGPVAFSIGNDTDGLAMMKREVVKSLVYDRTTDRFRITEVQEIMADWLLVQAGFPLRRAVAWREDGSVAGFTSLGWSSGPEAEESVERFSALPPDARRAWLTEHYVALRAGELTLEDLPRD